MSPDKRRAWLLALLLLTGCYPQAPTTEAVKSAADACDRKGGYFRYFHGLTVVMECTPRVQQ